MPVDKSEQRVRTMFAAIARRYDFLNHVLSAGVDIYWRKRTVRAVGSLIDGPILDVCTGTGDLALALRKQFPATIVVGTDFTPEMLVIAADKASARGRNGSWNGGVSWLQADTQALPFSDDTFALVTVAFGLRNVTDTDRGLEEMTRVCHPGGSLAILEFSKPNVPVLGAMYGWYFRHILPRIGQFLARNRQGAYEYLPQSVGEFPSGQALVKRMEDAGLVEATFTRLTFGVATLYQGRKPVPRPTESAAARHAAARTPVPA